MTPWSIDLDHLVAAHVEVDDRAPRSGGRSRCRSGRSRRNEMQRVIRRPSSHVVAERAGRPRVDLHVVEVGDATLVRARRCSRGAASWCGPRRSLGHQQRRAHVGVSRQSTIRPAVTDTTTSCRSIAGPGTIAPARAARPGRPASSARSRPCAARAARCARTARLRGSARTARTISTARLISSPVSISSGCETLVALLRHGRAADSTLSAGVDDRGPHSCDRKPSAVPRGSPALADRARPAPNHLARRLADRAAGSCGTAAPRSCGRSMSVMSM